MPKNYGGVHGASFDDSLCERCGKVEPSSKKQRYCEKCKDARKKMRLALMSGWYDPKDFGTVMRDKEIFLAALNFFVEFYLKKAPPCIHQYFFADCKHKPAMQAMFTENRSALVAPRESGKTFTLVFELIPFIAITRPNTPILIGSETKQLTKEKLKEIQRRVQENTRLYHDFGQVWPIGRSSAYDWSANECLDFLNGSSIRGSSIDQATRGRHPLVGIIDDPEGKRSKNPKWRKEFMKWLFKDYMNQFRDKGTHVMWIGTILDIDSCLYRAIHNDDEENRFITWDRRILKMVYEDEIDGKLTSCWPQKLTVEEFERKKRGTIQTDGKQNVTAIGVAAVAAEFQGEPIPSGDRMFCRDEMRHGYVTFKKAGKTYFYDPYTQTVHDLELMRQTCFAVAGVDVADSTRDDASKSGIVAALYDPDGIFWVVDAWSKRCFSDITAISAMRICHEWKVSRLAWESVTLGRRIYREAAKLRDQRLKDGFHVPQMIAITTDGIAKELRIERMKPDFDAFRFKFPLFKSVDGFKPITHPNRASLQDLIDQFDSMTNEGRTGSIDLIDAMEMLHRVTNRKPVRYKYKNSAQRQFDRWEKLGVEVDPAHVPEEIWTPAMREKFEKRIMPAEPVLEFANDAFV